MNTATAKPAPPSRFIDGAGDWIFRNIVAIAGWFVLTTLALAALSMAYPALKQAGKTVIFSELIRRARHPVNHSVTLRD